ncbi:MAG TPA: MarR family winged helix-turn-helix transcriptional regulator [Gemmatimonadales bacterium]
MSLSRTPRASDVQAAVQRCTCFNLRKAARAVTQMYDEFLRPSGLRATQFSLLMLVRGRGPVGITDLAEMAVMDRTTLKRNVELLEREGLVRIEPGEDARVREVSLTAAAEKRLGEALPLWQRAQSHITGELGQRRTDRLLGDLSAAIVTAEQAG